jgi:nitrous oxidase accessory protein NosD
MTGSKNTLRPAPRQFRVAALMIAIAGGAIALMTAAAPAFAATYYVATNGSDSNAGTQASPFATLQKAANIVNPGDTVLVADGTYTSSSTQIIQMSRAGKAGALVTFKSQNGLGAKLNGQNNKTPYAILFQSNNGGFVRIQDFEIYGFQNIAIVTSGSHDVEIVGNEIHDIGRLCTNSSLGIVGVYGNSSPNVTISANVFHDIGRFNPGENGCSPTNTAWQNLDQGIYLNGMNNTTVFGNQFYNLAHGYGVQVYSGNGYAMSNLLVSNNTFTGPNPNRDGQIVLAGKLSNSIITGNVFYEPRNFAISYSVGGYTYSNVAISNNTTYNAALSPSSPAGITFTGNLTQ